MEPAEGSSTARDRAVPTGSADGDDANRPRLASAVMFVRELGNSISFYCELLALEVVVQTPTAALLASPSGAQLYLRSMGPRATHPLGGIGVQYLIWTAAGEEDLRRCEQVLRSYSSQVSTEKMADGFTLVEGRSPDDVPVLLTYPGPDQAPRTQILQRIYRW